MEFIKFLGPIYLITLFLCMAIVLLISSYIFPHTEIFGVIWLLFGIVGSMYVAGSTKIYFEDKFRKDN
jgi:hypothetical protein